MEPQPDFEELLALFNSHGVDYLIAGGYAVAFYGAPRFTGDIDILVKPDAQNAQRIISALSDFGFQSSELTPADFEQTEKVIQIGVPPVRVDILTSLTGVSWEEAASGRVKSTYGKATVFYLGRPQLVTNKRALARKKDFADLEALNED
jgi:hypothetical protein